MQALYARAALINAVELSACALVVMTRLEWLLCIGFVVMVVCVMIFQTTLDVGWQDQLFPLPELYVGILGWGYVENERRKNLSPMR